MSRSTKRTNTRSRDKDWSPSDRSGRSRRITDRRDCNGKDRKYNYRSRNQNRSRSNSRESSSDASDYCSRSSYGTYSDDSSSDCDKFSEIISHSNKHHNHHHYQQQQQHSHIIPKRNKNKKTVLKQADCGENKELIVILEPNDLFTFKRGFGKNNNVTIEYQAKNSSSKKSAAGIMSVETSGKILLSNETACTLAIDIQDHQDEFWQQRSGNYTLRICFKFDNSWTNQCIIKLSNLIDNNNNNNNDDDDAGQMVQTSVSLDGDIQDTQDTQNTQDNCNGNTNTNESLQATNLNMNSNVGNDTTSFCLMEALQETFILAKNKLKHFKLISKN